MTVRWTAAALAVVAAAAWGAVDYSDFGRYDVILSRKPFGVPPPPPPPPADQAVAPPPGPPAFVKNLRLCALTETKYGLKVGFLDITKKPPKSYYLRVGQNEDGIEVADADYDKAAALLRKDGQEYWIYLKGDPTASGAAAGGLAAAGGAPRPGVGPAGIPVPGGAAGGRLGYYQRRLQRREEILEERRKEDAERQKVGAEELQKQLREYNLELIRAKGQKGPPLPIPLTEDEDKQLVKEGVLPPQ